MRTFFPQSSVFSYPGNERRAWPNYSLNLLAECVWDMPPEPKEVQTPTFSTSTFSRSAFGPSSTFIPISSSITTSFSLMIANSGATSISTSETLTTSFPATDESSIDHSAATVACPVSFAEKDGCQIFAATGTFAEGNQTHNLCNQIRSALAVPYSEWSTGHMKPITISLLEIWARQLVAAESYTTLVWGLDDDAVPGKISAVLHRLNHSAATLEIKVYALSKIPLSGQTFDASAHVESEAFTCGLEEHGTNVTLRLQLEAAPIQEALQTAVTVVTAASTTIATVVALPSGLIQANIAGKMMNMARCSEFIPSDEIDFINNPAGWAVGREELKYQRGGLLLSIIVSGFIIAVAFVAVLLKRFECDSWREAFVRSRLPSFLLGAVLLSSEIAVSPATSVVLFGGSNPEDYILALIAVLPLLAFLALYLYQTSFGLQVDLRSVSQEQEALNIATDVSSTTVPTLLQRVSRYLFQTTAQPVAKDTASQEWLEGNYYFVDEKAWAPYGALEAIGGLLASILEGIPLTSSNQLECTGRLVVMGIILGGLFGMLLLKQPFAVRYQQYTAIVIGATLLTSNSVNIANSIIQSIELEDASTYLILSASLIVLLCSGIEIALLVCSVAPSLGALMGLDRSTFKSVLGAANTKPTQHPPHSENNILRLSLLLRDDLSSDHSSLESLEPCDSQDHISRNSHTDRASRSASTSVDLDLQRENEKPVRQNRTASSSSSLSDELRVLLTSSK